MFSVKKFLLENTTVILDSNINDWQKAILISTDLLYDQACITEDYYPSIINITKDLGPYYILLPGIAMPHARPENGGLKSGVSCAYFPQGVLFEGVEDPVFILLAVCAKDSDTFASEIIPSVASFLQNNDLLTIIKYLKNTKELINMLEKTNE